MNGSATMLLLIGLITSSFAADSAPAPAIKISGDLQYRLRYSWVQTQQVKDVKTSTGDYANVYMWNLRFAAQPTEDLALGIRLSNPLGASCEVIKSNMLQVNKPDGTNLLAIPEFSFKWTYSTFSLAAGILPISGSTVLDLMAFESDSLSVGKKPFSGFDVTMNNSQKGINLGYTFLKNEETSFNTELLIAIASDSAGSKPADVFKKDQMRFFLKAPISLSKGTLTLQPAVSLRTNVARSADLEESNTSVIGGLDVTIKPSKTTSMKVGSAFGGFNTDADNVTTTALIAPRGFLAIAGASFSPGFGTLSLDYTYGLSKEMIKSAIHNDHQNFLDLKYALPFKKFSITPRVRWWHLTSSTLNVYKSTVRPELILKAAF